MSNPGAHPPERRHGLFVENIGGRLGWLARRSFPRASTKAYMLYVRLMKSGVARRRLLQYSEMEGQADLSHVEIETVNRCNGECAFCPVNRHTDPRPYQTMSDTLFSGIIRQLAAQEYSGYLGLFSNNEPLLDKRLDSMAAEARKALPLAYLNLSTNGRLLDIDRFRKLMLHFDRIVVNNYSNQPKMHDNIKAIHDFCLTPEGHGIIAEKALVISLRCDQDILSSRGGNAPNRQPPPKPLAMPCVLPFMQMIIRPDGKVSLCCNDALGQMTLGDLNRQTLSEVWQGKAYAGAREAMNRNGRQGLPLCQACDFVKQTIH